MSRELLRALPSVDRVAAALEAPHALAVAAARRAVDAQRAELRDTVDGAGTQAGADQHALMEQAVKRARRELEVLLAPSLRPVLNATGVILHTNLGRAPLALAARQAVARVAAGYSNLEMDATSGRRGSRQSHVSDLLCELTGAEAALVVNNGAGAALLAVAATAGPGGGVIVSRGQAIEIGGGFRIPEVVAHAGARLVEVGTTNRTRLADYRHALEDLQREGQAAAVLRVHPSNFRTLGFVESVEIEELCSLQAPVVDDLGSGALARELPALVDEPDVRRSLEAGVALASFSGDKLLGGPQAGILVGTEEAVAAASGHPLARALRIDKLSLAALEATLRLYRDPELARREIPTLAMLSEDEEALARRTQLIARYVGPAAQLTRGAAKVGGGALPLLELEGPVVAVDAGPQGAGALAARLRRGEPPLFARLSDDRLFLDPRTLSDEEAEAAGKLVAGALQPSC